MGFNIYTVKLIRIEIILLLFVVFSCKTDEFKFKEWTIDEQWSMEIVTPLLSGDMEFKDFIYNWNDTLIYIAGEQVKELKYPEDTTKTIPARIIFEPSAILDSFKFLIQGRYDFLEAQMVFKVKNGSPFPLNLQLQFFEKGRPNYLGPPILPDAFEQGVFVGEVGTIVESVDSVLLSNDQLRSFKRGNRLKVTSWFNKTAFIDTHDTLRSDYPISFSVILKGKVKAADGQ